MGCGGGKKEGRGVVFDCLTPVLLLWGVGGLRDFGPKRNRWVGLGRIRTWV